ncbi:MAG: glycine--tRNA ligase subunit beta [Alphaproteobacteria bacterium]|nr:glycine--tRNA ligase subunit beta [Alphaproteobacteria bacterium]
MAELLLELFCEEIPARMQARAAEDLQRLVVDGLGKAGLAHDGGRAFVAPRRLAVVVDGVPTAQPDVADERKGPRVGAPQPAIDGFLRAAGVTTLDDCEKRATDKGEFWFATIRRRGRTTIEVIPEIVRAAILAMPWPKSMRFGHSTFRWVRPLHQALCLFDGTPLAGAIQLDERTSLPLADRTVGHRFHAPAPFAVCGFADYAAKLEAARVVLDPAERARRIVAQATALAAGEGLALREDAALLAEVAGLVDWPVVLMGRIDAAFMDVPAEVLVTSMRAHQKYFAASAADGGLAPRFLVVANIQADDGGAAIVAGNERVLRARLSDAKFFWDQDRKVRLADRVPALERIVFHARLGTMGERVARLQALAADLAAFVPGCDRDVARSAAGLAKADLTSGMVGEFPELQGIMGRYYARHDGERDDVAAAIAEHYSPQGPGDRCPTAPIAVAVALADKIDALVGFFAIDEKPTGSKDPFALRRAALGVIRLVVENRLRLPLVRVLDGALDLYRPTLPDAPAAIAPPLLDFFADRLKVHLRGEGVRHDLVAAVFALGGEDDLVRLLARVAALGAFLASEDGGNLLTAYRRASNIVRIEEKKDGPHDGAVDVALLADGEERELAAALAAARSAVEAALAREDFAAAMRALAGLRGPVDAFFDRVTVNAPDPALRANRLRLLSEIRATLGRVADFAQIEG